MQEWLVCLWRLLLKDHEAIQKLCGMSKLFISHSSQDDGFVRELRAALALHGQDGWIDSRELRGGDPLWMEIQRAIEDASAYAVVISTDALQSKWVGKELRYALKLR